MNTQRLTLYASQTARGWQIVDNGGNILDNGQTGITNCWDSYDECLSAIRAMYPSNSVWHGRITNDNGWSIVI